MEKEQNTSPMTYKDVFGNNIPQIIISIIALILSIFQLLTGYFQLEAMDQRTIHLMIGYLLIFLLYSFKGTKEDSKFNVDGVILGLAFFAISMYLLLTWDQRLGTTGLGLDTKDFILGAILLVITLEGARRVIGSILPVMCILIFLFAVCGEMMPGIFAHKNYPVERIVSSMTLKTDGLYGELTGLSATFIYLLVLFGVIYNKSGAGKFFMDFALSLAGHLRGGIAKVAIIASALFGMISGSGVANTAATGNMTIPTMKSEGYSPHFAGAVVAAAGSGGLIMPPIMGSAVFIIMSILGVPYLEIITRCLIIAILFYVAVFLITDIISIKLDIKGKPKDQIPSTKKVFREGWNYFLPPLVLVVCLLLKLTIIKASFFACLSIPLAAGIRKSTRMSFTQFLGSLKDGAISATHVIAILSVASIAVGLVNFTGLGLMISTILIKLAHGNLFVMLILTMIASIVLGMGVPPVAAYVVLSILVVPALVQLGVWPFAAHMFVFYFSVIAEISPPVAPNAYVACGIAGAPLMKTSLTALRIAFPIIILPYAFVYNNALLLEGSTLQVIMSIVFATCSVIAISCFWENYCFGKLRLWGRAVFFIAGIFLVTPYLQLNIAGLIAVVLVALYIKKKNSALPQQIAS